jgi:hypothetical protein
MKMRALSAYLVAPFFLYLPAAVADAVSSSVVYQAVVGSQLVGLSTQLTVPSEPAKQGTLFLWPGVQPDTGAVNYMPISNGVLQPVLTWGPSCAPDAPSETYASWWISGQYVNTYGDEIGYKGCLGGAVMPVNVGDQLVMNMTLDGTTWTQTILDLQTLQSVSYAIDMKGQEQDIADFDIEDYSAIVPGDIVFTNTVLTFSGGVFPSNCSARIGNTGNSASAPVIIDNGKQCRIDKIVLKM